MVDLQRAVPLGGISRRNIFLFAASFFVAVFALLMAFAPIAHAADATWQGSSINYASKQFIKTADAGDNDPRGLPKGTQIYAYIEPNTSSPSQPTQKAHLIYFAPGADPAAATTATYATYDYTPPNVYANPSSALSITIEAQNANTTSSTSCALEGIGWIICPITNFLASAMDKLFEVLSTFLEVRPMQTSQDNALFRIWSVMRNFANIVFVIGFLIIIYAQVTSVGISNYSIKQILPRLIVAALLVNVSYWICAVAIDISNIMGNSLQQLFISLRNVLVVNDQNGWNVGPSFSNVAGFILSGGTAAVLTGIGAQAILGGTITGSVFLLVPILVTVLVAVLVALLVMALRQALITVLVIVSPLAFVAYLLPNTEKYFEKWRELFMTMLLMYPILSIIFGGSQLAGLAIIHNADSINLILLGMAVQVAPLIVTPLIIKFSGALLTRFAGIVNNPSKGLIDRTRNWAKDRAENQKAHVLGQPAAAGWRGAFTRRSQNIDTKRRKREGLRAANQSLADARWANSQQYSDIQQIAMRAATAKDLGETNTQARYETSKYTNAHMQQLEIDARAAKLNLDFSKARVESDWDELKAGDIRSMVAPEGLSVSGLANYAHNRRLQAQSILRQSVESAVEGRRSHSAKEHFQSHLAEQLIHDNDLQLRAGGIAGRLGADAAIADATKQKRKAYNDAVEDAAHLMKHFNLNGADRQKLAMGGTITVTDPATNIERTFDANSTYMREAVIDAQLSGQGSFGDIQEIITNSGGTLQAFKTSIGEAIPQYKITDKAPYLGGMVIDMVKQGKIASDTDLNKAIAMTIGKGKIKPEHLATMDPLALERLFDVAKSGNTAGVASGDLAKYPARIKELGVSANTALTNPSLKGRLADNVREQLEEMVQRWPPSS